MPNNHLFEYAIIRVVPRVEREEFFNVGVIVYCAQQKFLKARYQLDAEKIRCFGCTIDEEAIKNNLEAYMKICEGGKDSGPIGMLDNASRFRWLTSTRSTMVQSSKVHPGLCDQASVTLDSIFEKFVL